MQAEKKGFKGEDSKKSFQYLMHFRQIPLKKKIKLSLTPPPFHSIFIPINVLLYKDIFIISILSKNVVRTGIPNENKNCPKILNV